MTQSTNLQQEQSGLLKIDTEAAPPERVYPPFEVMTKNLFKLMPEGNHSSLMHAAIGMSGEAAELLTAISYKNILEECGDIEFYMVAAEQQLPEANALPNFDRRVEHMTFSTVVPTIVAITGDILDVAKKAWVYNKTLDVELLHSLLAMLRINLDALYGFIGTNFVEAIRTNQVKLIGPGGRFESGFYSDAAAVQRADKVEPGTDRSFIGKK